MHSHHLLITASMLATALSVTGLAMAGEHSQKVSRSTTKRMQATPEFDHGMKAIPHSASPDAPGHGWRYFSDPSTRRAVVISPQGDYYYSRGQGLRWVAAEQI